MSICCKQYDASYTVEATAIFGITIGILMAMILLGFRVYHTYSEEILSYERELEDPADTFRLISCGKDVLEEVFGN